jgi:hypothetical protein|tara:strand:+ start:66 stop:1010 length:945 start_codon:yes stop_codon:yes gene_type:complete
VVAKLKSVKIQSVWKKEDRDFTPWLVENINRLNEDIGLNLQDPKKETKLINFRPDIVADDDQGKVIIENQFSSTDHDHLGKLITYLSNVEETKKAIWIVEKSKTEHTNTIRWLNENIDSCSFYLVKVQLFKIKDNDEPAVRFELISGPDITTKTTGKIKKEDAERLKIRFQFWSMFLEKAKGKMDLFSGISPGKHSWISTGSGLRGMGYGCVVRETDCQFELYIDRGKDQFDENKKIFKEFHKRKDEIEKKFGDKLNWEELPNRRACRISKGTEAGGWADEETWEKAHDSLIDIAIRFENTFDQYIDLIRKKIK